MGYERSGRKSTIIKTQRLDFRPKPPGLVPKAKGDRKRHESRGWIRNVADERAFDAGFRFNEALGEHVVEFFDQFLRHSQGKWAGQPFVLGDYHRDEFILPLFSWVCETGLRRFNATYEEEPKKQGKSAIASGVGLYMLVGDGENGAHNYSFGADKSQASVVHKEAIMMVEWSPALDAVLEINRTTGEIRYPATKSWYQASSSQNRGKHGIKMHCGIFDELHEWFGRKLWDQLKFAGRSREQPIRLVITNAGDDESSVCYGQRAKALRIESGEYTDHHFLCNVLRVPEDEARAEIDAVANGATTLPVAARCNPMLGEIVSEDQLVQDIRDAVESPSELPNLLRLTYGIWVASTADPLLPSGTWAACRDAEFDEESLVGEPCVAALDVGEVSDPTSFALAFPSIDGNDETDTNRHYRVLVWSWMARNNALNPKNKNRDFYTRWQDDPLAKLKLTRGDVTDFSVVRNDLIRLLNRFECQLLLFDPKKAEKLTQEICEGVFDGHGNSVLDGVDYCERVKFPQTLQHYGEPTREFEVAVLQRRIAHDGNPLLAWEAEHCSFVRDDDGNKKPVKPGNNNDHRKVDAIQAIVMALGGSMSLDLTSAYAHEGGGVVLF